MNFFFLLLNLSPNTMRSRIIFSFAYADLCCAASPPHFVCKRKMLKTLTLILLLTNRFLAILIIAQQSLLPFFCRSEGGKARSPAGGIVFMNRIYACNFGWLSRGIECTCQLDGEIRYA